MKNVAKCDTWCEFQNPINHQVFEHKLCPNPLDRWHICLDFTHRVTPSYYTLITGSAIIALRILASHGPRARGWPKYESASMDVTSSGGSNSTLFAVTATAHRAFGHSDPIALRHSNHEPRSATAHCKRWPVRSPFNPS
ncbi:hypothetical protein FXO37_36645 [Capsicum annuum]|nr:hypothetical protein FXO37_36645 [Capsicum annuum]